MKPKSLYWIIILKKNYFKQLDLFISKNIRTTVLSNKTSAKVAGPGWLYLGSLNVTWQNLPSPWFTLTYKLKKKK